MEKYTVTTIDLLRHGKPEGGEIFRGFTDVPLTEEGWQQMRSALEGLSGWQQVVSSPLQRCLDFSESLALDVAVAADLAEISFGDWDGQSFKAVSEQNKVLFDSFWRDPIANTPPNAEPMLVFCERVQAAFWQAIEDFQGQHLLMVAHGGVIRAVLQHVLKSDVQALTCYEVPYACISRIKVYHDESGSYPQLVFHNR